MPGFTVAADADNSGLDATQILGPATRCQANPSWAWSASQAATLCSNDPRCVAFSTRGARSVNGVTYPSYICLRMMGVAASANVTSAGTCYYTKGGESWPALSLTHNCSHGVTRRKGAPFRPSRPLFFEPNQRESATSRLTS